MALEVLPDIRLKYQRGRVTQPTDPPYLDHRFQDWLADGRIGLMTRNPRTKELVEDLARVGGDQYRGELTRQGQLLQFLLSQEGYLVSTARVAQVLYNGYSGPCELNGIAQVCHRLRDNLHYPELLYRRLAIGMGVGVEDFSLQLFGLRLLYPLWRNQGDWVRLDELGQEVYNSADSFIFDYALKAAIYRLRKTLSNGYATIETRWNSPYQNQNGAYRLVES